MRAHGFFHSGAAATGLGGGLRAHERAPLSCRTRRSVVPYALATLVAARERYTVSKPQKLNVYSSMVSHPYSIYIWHAAHGVHGQPAWYEALQAYTEDDALYTANLIHMESNAVIKVVRYGLNLACFPDEHTVELCERQIAQQQQRVLEQE